MKVILVSLFNNRAERFRTLGTELTARGHTVVMVTSEPGDPLPFETIVIPFTRSTRALRRAVGVSASANVGEAARKRGRAAFSIVSFLARTFETLFSHPDKYGRWVRAVRRDLIRHESLASSVDVVVAAPPASGFSAGAMAARHCDAPLVADFQDLWVTGNRYYPFGSLRGLLDLRRERRLMGEASLAITDSGTFTSLLLSAYPGTRTETLYIGVDPELWRAAQPADDGKLTFAHFGATYAGARDLRPLLRSIRSLIDGGMLSVQQVRLNLFGEFDEPARQCTDELGLGDVVEYGGVIPPSEVPEQLARTDVAVLLVWMEDEAFFPSKSRHYLASGNTILVFGASPTSEAAKQLSGLPGVVLCHSEDDVRAALAEFARRFLAGEGFVWSEEARPFPYSAAAMTDRFIELVEPLSASQAQPDTNRISH